jgi:hypothetical protein
MSSSGTHDKSGTVVSGDVVHAEFALEFPSEVDEGAYWEYLSKEGGPRLQEITKKLLGDALGEEFTLGRLTWRQGSIDVMATIVATHGFIASYDEFVESVELFVDLVTSMLEQAHPSVEPTVRGSWTPGPAVREA